MSEKLSLSERVRGMMLGVGVGDALGMPAEMYTAEQIDEKFGRITKYLEPTGHKYFDGMESGSTTDDTQLTIAVMEGLMDDTFSMEAQAKRHVEAYKTSCAGWGGTTREAVRNLANGADWRTSGREISGINRGMGNGVIMKLAPVAAIRTKSMWFDSSPNNVFNFLTNLTIMTHHTRQALQASYAYFGALICCLQYEPVISLDFFREAVRDLTLDLSEKAKTLPIYDECIPATDDLSKKLGNLTGDKTRNKIIEEHGGGSCYCIHSLPFTLEFFLKNPSLDGLFDIVSAGGDTDSNGSMFGAMLGAIHGPEIFEEHLISGLKDPTKLCSVTDDFCAKFID